MLLHFTQYLNSGTAEHAELYLESGIMIAALKSLAKQQPDLEAREAMQKARTKLLNHIFGLQVRKKLDNQDDDSISDLFMY